MKVTVNNQNMGNLDVSPLITIKQLKEYFRTNFPEHTITFTFSDGQILDYVIWTTDQYDNMDLQYYTNVIAGGSIVLTLNNERTMEDQDDMEMIYLLPDHTTHYLILLDSLINDETRFIYYFERARAKGVQINLDYLLYQAIFNNKINIVTFLVGAGVGGDLEPAIKLARFSGKHDIVLYLEKQKHEKDLNQMIERTHNLTNKNVVMRQPTLKHVNFNLLLTDLIMEDNYVSFIHYYDQARKEDYPIALGMLLNVAAEEGNKDFVQFLVEAGANNINEAIGVADEEGHEDIVRYLRTIR